MGWFGECSRHPCEVSEIKPVGVELCFRWPFTECNYSLNVGSFSEVMSSAFETGISPFAEGHLLVGLVLMACHWGVL